MANRWRNRVCEAGSLNAVWRVRQPPARGLRVEERVVVYRLLLLLATITLTSFLSALANAQPPAPATRMSSPPVSQYTKMRDAANRNVVTLVSGRPDGSFLYTAHDIAAVLERTSNVRVMPIVGKGGAQNVKDVLYMKGIDMGIMHPHVIRHFQRTGEVGPNIERRIAYITTLFSDELHVLAKDTIADVRDLAGKRVNFSIMGSSTQISMRLIFQALGINVEEVNVGQEEAFELMRQGKLDATTCTCAKPLRSLRAIGKNSGFKFLAVPYTDELEQDFYPGLLTHKDYPELIPAGQSINTVAAQTILGVYNWNTKTTERYQRVARFIETFFERINEFHKPPRQPKWKNVNLAATVRGMLRFEPAQEWLNRNASRGRLQTTGVEIENSDVKIDKGLARQQAARAAPNSPAEQEKLFHQFLKWVQRRPANP